MPDRSTDPEADDDDAPDVVSEAPSAGPGFLVSFLTLLLVIAALVSGLALAAAWGGVWLGRWFGISVAAGAGIVMAGAAVIALVACAILLALPLNRLASHGLGVRLDAEEDDLPEQLLSWIARHAGPPPTPRRSWGSLRRAGKAPCPCGSGRKFAGCCGKQAAE